MSAIESLQELAALVLQVADDRGRAVRLDSTGEALLEVDLAAIGGDRQLAGQVEALHAELVHDLELDVVPADGELADARGRGHRHDAADLAGPLQGDFQGDHAAQRSAHREGQLADPQRVEEAPLGPGLIADRDAAGTRGRTACRSRGCAKSGRWCRSGCPAGSCR